MENEENGVTLGRVFKVAFSNWKLLVPVSLVVAVGCALGVHFGLNSYRGSYSTTFGYSSSDLTQNKYADGSNFAYRTLISSSNLENIKQSDEKYSGINVQSILDSNAISISNDEEAKTYTLTLRYSSIKDSAIAKSFMADISNSALDRDADIVKNGSFDNSLQLYDEAETFEQQVTHLYGQANFLISSYKALSDDLTLSISARNSAAANSEKVSMLVGTGFVERLNLQIAKNGYVKDYECQEAKNYEVKKEQLLQEKSLNDDKVSALEAQISAISSEAAIASFSEEVETLVFRNVDIDYEVSAIDNKLANKGKASEDIPGYDSFVASLADYRSKLANAVNDYKNVLKAAYINDAEVTYTDTSIIKLNGTTNIYINIALSLVVGVVVGAAVNLIVDRKKLFE